MALFIVERELEGPEHVRSVQAAERRAGAAQPAGGARWLRAYYSRDGRNAVSFYEAAEHSSVLRLQDGLPHARAWPATAIAEHSVQPPRGYVLVVAQRAMPQGITVDVVRHLVNDPKGCNDRLRLVYVGGYLSGDLARMCCVYYSPDVESVRVANREEGVPYERLWSGEALHAGAR